MEFVRSYLIRFAHCDPAGMVFYPRYFELFNDHVEDWFADELGMDFASMHSTHRLGVPTVHLECDFANPSRHGDQVEFALQVSRLGRTSVTLDRCARVGDDVRVRLSQVLACINLDSTRARPWPEHVREAFTPFLTTPD